MKTIKLRAVLSLLLLVTFIVSLFTGLGLYFSPSGKTAKQTEWNFFGFEKRQLENLHTVFGFAMSVLIVIHLIVNYKLFFSEIRALVKKQ